LVGGISLDLGHESFVGLCAPQMLGVEGRCFTFDESGTGYARGEACFTMYIRKQTGHADKSLAGCYANQDGRSASMTAPNGPSQQQCWLGSLNIAQIDVDDVKIVECHGTGTALGDPIEVGAIKTVMKSRQTVLCATSAKCMIGHTEAGAGVAGLEKLFCLLENAVATPNIHLHQLNPHLAGDADFPILYEVEHVDCAFGVGSYGGCSSFGWGGTNGHADVWVDFKRHSSQQMADDKNNILRTVLCPITLEPIHHITGESMTPYIFGTESYHADALRDDFAPYDISTHAYKGSFRFRRSPVEDSGGELPPENDLYICGSWSGFGKFEKMQHQGDGWYSAMAVLGEGRYELFSLSLNMSEEIYPAINRASERIHILGPDEGGKGHKWIVDGRATCVPSGTLYCINFMWSWERKLIHWEQVSGGSNQILAKGIPIFEHSYFIAGSWTGFKCVAMQPIGCNVWECYVKISSSGQEEFQFARDHDVVEQVIYPAKRKTLKTSVPIRGPDNLGQGKYWLIRGPPGDLVTIRLEIHDAAVKLSVSSATKGTKNWKSIDAWRHEYCVIGSFNGWQKAPMKLDSSSGIFRFQGTLRVNSEKRGLKFAEFFQIIVDEDEDLVICPQAPDAGLREHMARDPIGDLDLVGGRRNKWMITSPKPNISFEIVLNSNAEDRREIVTWAFPQSNFLTDQNED